MTASAPSASRPSIARMSASVVTRGPGRLQPAQVSAASRHPSPWRMPGMLAPIRAGSLPRSPSPSLPLPRSPSLPPPAPPAEERRLPRSAFRSCHRARARPGRLRRRGFAAVASRGSGGAHAASLDSPSRAAARGRSAFARSAGRRRERHAQGLCADDPGAWESCGGRSRSSSGTTRTSGISSGERRRASR